METKDTLPSCSNSEAQQMQQIQDKAKKSCMVSFRQLHSHLKRLSKNDLQGSRTEFGLKRVFTTLSGQDTETFTGTMFLNVEQLEKQLDKEYFQEIGSTFTGTTFLNMEQLEKQLDKEDFQEIGSIASFNENETLKKRYKELFDSIMIIRAKTTEHTTSLIATNDKFKAQFQEKGFAIAELKNELRKSTGYSVNTKFAKSSILGKPMSQPLGNQSVVRQPTAFKSERPRISKPRCDSQVDVNYDLSKPIITHYLPKEREAASTKPHHMIASSNSRISSKNMPRFSSNDMVHNHCLEEAKKRTQERSRNSKPSLIPSARSQSTANGSKPKPRINNQTSRNWPASKNSYVTTMTVPIAEHFRNSRIFSDPKHFVCSTCHKCVFSANHDSCLTKFLKEVNSRAKVPSNKTPKRNKPVKQISVPNE
nr:hypothetical protein [Tanacetum cinerariifolium]